MKTDELKILQAQISTDIKEIIDSLNGEVYWEGVMKALDRLNEKQKRFNKLVSDMIEQAEAEGLLNSELSEEDEYEAEQAEKAKEEAFNSSRGVGEDNPLMGKK